MKGRLLLVEDEEHIAEAVQDALRDEGFEVTWVAEGEDALQLLRGGSFDLVLLDVRLPGIDGFETCRTLRERGDTTPVLFLTALRDTDSRVRGLAIGGDDYLPKPFHLAELLARIHGILRRREWYARLPLEGPRARVGEAEVDLGAREIRRGGQTHRLSEKETMILKLLLERRGETVARDRILDTVWGYDAFPTPRTVDNFVVRLRKALEPDADAPRYLLTVRGVGYVLQREEPPAGAGRGGRRA